MKRKQLSVKIQKVLEFEKLIAELSSEYINISVNELDAGITNALSRIGKFMKVDRSFSKSNRNDRK